MDKEMKIISETHMLKDEVALEMQVEVYGREELDTECVIDGAWVVEGGRRKEFAEKLAALVGEYCI